MPLDIGETVNSIVDYVCNSKLAHSIISSPFIVALLLTAIIVTIFLGFFYNSIKGEPKTSFIKLYIYSFLIGASILLLHYACQERDIEKKFGITHGQQLVEAVAAIGGIRNESSSAAETKIGGAFTKVSTEPCPCTAAGATHAGIKAEGGKIDSSAGVGTGTIAASSSAESSQQQMMNKPTIQSGGDLSKVSIKPVTKSPFSAK